MTSQPVLGFSAYLLLLPGIDVPEHHLFFCQPLFIKLCQLPKSGIQNIIWITQYFFTQKYAKFEEEVAHRESQRMPGSNADITFFLVAILSRCMAVAREA